MKNYIVNELIAAMKERIPRGINLANYLTDALCMGKEAVYRRLRGEVAFTFDEIAMISCKSPVEPCDFRFKPASLTRSSGKLL